MKIEYSKIIHDLEKDLKEIEKTGDIINTSENSITIIQACLNRLRKIIISTEFKTKEDEIEFFKNIKPVIVSKFIYYAMLFKIENKRPKGSVKIQKKYFDAEIHKCQEYFYENHVFYQYFRGNESYSDEQFFLRKNKSIRISFDCCGSYIDDDFAASLDSTFSKFIGFEMLIQYFQNEINKLTLSASLLPHQNAINSSLKWTLSKIALIELIYALDGLKVFNNGDADIKQIASAFETIFNIDLGDYYRAFLEIKMRKNNNTKFLDNLKRALTNRILKFDK